MSRKMGNKHSSLGGLLSFAPFNAWERLSNRLQNIATPIYAVTCVIDIVRVSVFD